jgi:hypothetical protein
MKKLTKNQEAILEFMQKQYEAAAKTEAAAHARAIGGLSQVEKDRRKCVAAPDGNYLSGHSLRDSLKMPHLYKSFFALAKLGRIEHIGDGYWKVSTRCDKHPDQEFAECPKCNVDDDYLAGM